MCFIVFSFNYLIIWSLRTTFNLVNDWCSDTKNNTYQPMSTIKTAWCILSPSYIMSCFPCWVEFSCTKQSRIEWVTKIKKYFILLVIQHINSTILLHWTWNWSQNYCSSDSDLKWNFSNFFITHHSELTVPRMVIYTGLWLCWLVSAISCAMYISSSRH